MAEVLQIEIQDKAGGGSSASGPPRPPSPGAAGSGPAASAGPGLGGLAPIPTASLTTWTPWQSAVIDLLNQEVGLLTAVHHDLGGKGTVGGGQGGGGKGGVAKKPAEPSLTGGLAKLGVQGPAQIVGKAEGLAEGGAELAESLGASAGAAAAFGATVTGVGLGIVATGAGLMLSWKMMQGVYAIATGKVEMFGIKLASAMDDIAGFSAELTGAKVQASITDLIDNFREAQATGPQMAQIVASQSQIQHELREAFLPIKVFLLQEVGAFLELVKEWLPEVRGALAGLLQAIKLLEQLLTDAVNRDFGDMKDHVQVGFKNIKDAVDKAMRKLDEKPVATDMWLRDLYALEVGKAAAPARGGDSRLNIPAVVGMAGL